MPKTNRLPLSGAWRLGLWYLELSLLRLVGFSGVYSNLEFVVGLVGAGEVGVAA
ncbi:MAG: hypothetical protein HY699_20220 [Deltaproteobacteria bacterium]|nr:hypothetical protein [Deltaproteobacteria bacterium]